ncbi:MAG: translation initiation factor IF-3 [Candidatus Taylorbacteria bacterium RIFCSPLOWO2_02_FULL_43_11]|uniref:Translation initiation factor IF-3 n=1 Tax=Candidatus Taylorbacteria bacterium RIFCSPHIGHO2_02_FULL_43_32b TaxID=1802306 RepID=A0A1G2MMC4_9BACT|nr:MAG: translation initiation factor IF-3 [Candidatus Taylorbacteria bacterium RIFCSPHIGHO2_01_FULL_43_47]OHA25050.1 MAG: translation initiation factor IF-3 [Candidatus Taylorbacteria bacterium RIFCSPHIGHO2_02_FULL_43_32b]OHA31920.1 MAG: translation initiation factor IF-3 [Candidatus Taylorbacteria bacterium RIFCSPLOWO2_01_FULL_43_44]OHA35772.1 MAG: translation initiation factor IF-3 [Candidatus Taylorbacteria bacterium RIFCSPLOWO2_02_FULL_43_11]
MSNSRTRINHQIRAVELRVIGAEGENIGVIPTSEALKRAEVLGLDLIEISPNANPPVAKIMDYGKYQYTENKKTKLIKAKAQNSEIKEVQVKIGTGEHDLELKASKVTEWLKEKNVVRIDLFLPGRSKYLDNKFLVERINRILKFVSEPYKISQPPSKSPKGMSMTIEKA